MRSAQATGAQDRTTFSTTWLAPRALSVTSTVCTPGMAGWRRRELEEEDEARELAEAGGRRQEGDDREANGWDSGRERQKKRRREAEREAGREAERDAQREAERGKKRSRERHRERQGRRQGEM